MAGDGMYAHGLNPIPTNFTDPGTIAQLQESFLFWRIAKGGPGLPDEGGPWDSAMPAWEKFLKEEEIWEVVLFLYDHTGQRPRGRVEEAEHATRRYDRRPPSLLVGLALLTASGRLRRHRRRSSEAGKKVYELHCAQCHGEKGDGAGARGGAPAAPAARLHGRQVQAAHDAARARSRPTTT